MRNLLGVVIATVGISAGCSKPSPTSSSKKESNTEQPVEVSGGFGLTMQCSVMNREVIGATSSEIGCIVNNDDGSKFSGDMTDLKASIKAKGRQNPVIASPELISGSSPINISLKIDNLPPADAESIDLSGKFDNKPATLAATLKGRFALICDEDTTYYVLAEAPKTNLACTEQAPCREISQAVALLPDVFNCSVTIKVAAGRKYAEQVKISGKQITDKGSLAIIGVTFDGNNFGNAITAPTSDADYALIEPPTNLEAPIDPITLLKMDRPAISIRSFGTSVANVTISNIAIDGKEAATLANQDASINFSQSLFETAIQADTSFVVIKNAKMINLRSTAVKSANSSRVHLQNTIIGASLAGVEAVDSFLLSMSGNLDIHGPGGSGTSDEPPYYSQVDSFGIKTTRTVFKTISSGAEFATLLISGVRTGLWLNQATVDLAQKSNITVQSVHTGLKLQDNAHWKWNPGLMQMPSSGPILQPKLELIKCAYTCVALDKSKLTLETEISDRRTAQAANKIRPRLTLRGVARQSDLQDEAAKNQEELTAEFLHMGIIKADHSSSVMVSFWENIWCDYPNYSNISNNESTAALFLSENSNLIYKKTEFSSENGCIKSGTMTSKLLLDGSSDKLDSVINMGPNANISIQRYESSSIGSQGRLVNILETHVLDLFSVPLILNSPYTPSTAGGDPLRIYVEGLKSVASVTIGETPAAIAKFDTENQELWIIPPPNNPSTTPTDDVLITMQVEAESLGEPGVITLSYRGIEYQNECPNNYFEVPANTDLGTSKFCVMTFEAKDLNGRAYSSHQGSPVINIPRDGINGAINRCNSISPYHKLISNTQWQAIAEFLIHPDQDNFWDYDNGGYAIPVGHSDMNPMAPQAATDKTGSGNECFNTGNNDVVDNIEEVPPPDGICDAGRSQEPQARYFYAPGTGLWDIAGNAAEWVSDDFTHAGIAGVDNYASQFAPGANIFAPLDDYTAYNSGIYGGFGYLKINAPAGTYGIARGGSYLDGDKSGVFAADATLDPNQGYPNVGFRCVVVPPETVP